MQNERILEDIRSTFIKSRMPLAQQEKDVVYPYSQEKGIVARVNET
jgi:hypothetical protein